MLSEIIESRESAGAVALEWAFTSVFSTVVSKESEKNETMPTLYAGQDVHSG